MCLVTWFLQELGGRFSYPYPILCRLCCAFGYFEVFFCRSSYPSGRLIIFLEVFVYACGFSVSGLVQVSLSCMGVVSKVATPLLRTMVYLYCISSVIYLPYPKKEMEPNSYISLIDLVNVIMSLNIYPSPQAMKRNGSIRCPKFSAQIKQIIDKVKLII